MTSSDPHRFSGLIPAGFLTTGTPLPLLPFAVVDVETTGLRPRQDRIIEIAVVRCDPRGEPLSEWSTLIDPGRDPGPTRVHGISASDLIGAPTFPEAVPQLLEQLSGAVVVAHNLSFDAAFVSQELRRSDAPSFSGYGLCTLELARVVLAGQSGFSLGACAAALGIAHPDAHRALADTRVTARLLQQLIARIAPDAPVPPALHIAPA